MRFPLLLLSFVTVAIVCVDSPLAPTIRGANAPANEYSAIHAQQELKLLLGRQDPHPTGSPANDRMRDRLIARLRELNLSPRAPDCSLYSDLPDDSRINNVLAEIPGESPDALLLMAHYDSVDQGPGAGDDGAGVAAIIETARALRLQPKSRNSVLLLFTDGEEKGLRGANAFFQHSLESARVKAVINHDAAGSSGPVVLLRACPKSGALIRAFRSVAPFVQAQSLFDAVFSNYMTNNTGLMWVHVVPLGSGVVG